VTTVTDIAGWAAGYDEQVWTELVRRHGSMLNAIARQFRMASDDGDDAAQMTWLALLQNAHKVREPEKVAAWLATSMRRNCLKILRRRQHELVSDNCAQRFFTDPWEAVDDRLVHADRDVLLWDSVDRLPPRQRDLVRTLFGADMSYGDVSVKMSMPVGAIGPTRHRALRRLEKMLVGMGN
jgi:RNA polymerase sigma factor (sigma-70 family)